MATKKTVYEAPAPARRTRKKALQTALAQIEKNFGKGTVMRLGDRPEMNVEAISDRLSGTGRSARYRRRARRAESSRSTDRNRPVRPRWRCTFWQKPRSGAAKWPSWTRNMPLTLCMPPRWAWIRTICWCPSRIPVSRHWKLPTLWSGPAPWMRWLWTPLPRWFPSRKSRAKWAIPLWACRPGSCLRPCGSWREPFPRPTAWSFLSTSCV